MAESVVQLPPDSTGKKLRTLELTIGTNVVEQEVVALPQSLDAFNSTTRTSATGASQWQGTWTPTRGVGVVRILTVLASTVTSGLGGTFVFEFSEDENTATISESRTITSFATVRDFDLINAGAYYRATFTPSRALVGGELVFINTTLRMQDDGQFVRLANQQIEEANAAMGQTFVYLKAFDETTGLSTNIRPTSTGDLRVGQQAVQDTGNSTTGVVLPAFGGVLYVSNAGGAPGATHSDMFVGSWFPCANYAGFGIDACSTAVGYGFAEWSDDGGATISRYETTPFVGCGAFTDPPQGATHGRILFQNVSATTNTFKSHVSWRYTAPALFMFPAAAPISGTFPAALTKSILTGQKPDGTYADVSIGADQSLHISATPSTVRVDYDASSRAIYIGKASPGASDSSGASTDWTLFKLAYTGINQSPDSVKYATGVAWANRATTVVYT